jgi:hypothetical protein
MAAKSETFAERFLNYELWVMNYELWVLSLKPQRSAHQGKLNGCEVGDIRRVITVFQGDFGERRLKNSKTKNAISEFHTNLTFTVFINIHLIHW